VLIVVFVCLDFKRQNVHHVCLVHIDKMAEFTLLNSFGLYCVTPKFETKMVGEFETFE
jgi:hypothetical protein